MKYILIFIILFSLIGCCNNKPNKIYVILETEQITPSVQTISTIANANQNCDCNCDADISETMYVSPITY